MMMIIPREKMTAKPTFCEVRILRSFNIHIGRANTTDKKSVTGYVGLAMSGFDHLLYEETISRS